MAVLALGDKAAAPSFYAPFRDADTQSAAPADSQQQLNRVVVPTTTTTTSIHSSQQLSESTSPAPDDLWITFTDLLEQKHEQFGNNISGLRRMIRRLQHVQTATQWETFMHSGGASVPLSQHHRATIRVQPGSVGRRRPGVSRGSKRRPTGRPPSSDPPRKRRKRPRNLQLSVDRNQPNAKGHGDGH